MPSTCRTTSAAWNRDGAVRAGRGMTDLLDLPMTTLQGEPTTLAALTGRRPALVVNVASRCGLTPQYAALEALQREYAPRGFTVVGVPCNQFMGQEPGTAEEIAEFCSATYGVTFPMTEKTEVNGPGAHPLYRRLTEEPDATGAAGDVEWNFEKFLLDGDGRVVARFRPKVQPESDEVRSAIEALLF
jgi:glutathione peroxidase